MSLILTGIGFLATALSALLLLTYLGWGLYTLRLRYVRHDDLSLRTECITLVGVFLFFLCEFWLLRLRMGEDIYFLFSLLGLVVSGAALYGPMIVSVAAQVIVDLAVPKHHQDPNKPHYGPAEALEEQGDYRGAIEEYIVLMRVYPKEPTAPLRIADNYVKLGQEAESVAWFERALARIDLDTKAVRVTFRLSDIYARQLNKPEEATRVLKEFLEHYEGSEHEEAVRKRLDRLSNPSPTPVPRTF